DFACEGGAVRFIDFMPLSPGRHSVVRIVEGLDGTVPINMSLILRFGYGHYKPWTRKVDGAVAFTVAPDSCILRTPMPLDVDQHDARGVVIVKKGEHVPFELSWYPSYGAPPPPLDVEAALTDTERLELAWAGKTPYRGIYADEVKQSLVVLKAMIYDP